MKFLKQKIADVFLIEPEPFIDRRGLFRRQFCQRELFDHGIRFDVRQCSISENKLRHTCRGLHYQKAPHQEGKILSCLKGSIHDVIVDLRPGSATYLQWMAVGLNEGNRVSLYVPPGCANGYMTLADDTWIFYYHSEFYTPGSESGIRYNDPYFTFKWPAEPAVISEKDLHFPDFILEKSD